MAPRRGSATDWETFEVGDQVRHPTWGVGSILFKSGTGETAKAIVVFPDEGQKKLALKFAKLERIQESIESEEDEFGLEEAPAEEKKEKKEEKPEEEKKAEEPEAEKDADSDDDEEEEEGEFAVEELSLDSMEAEDPTMVGEKKEEEQ